MAYGTDPTKTTYKTTKYSLPPREIDRFDECMENTSFFNNIILLKYSSGA
jgi:hypothetical protein